MRGPVSLLFAFSGCLSLTSALPKPDLTVRAAPAAAEDKPKYSIVPLEPGDDGEPGGDGGSGGDDDGDGVVTVVHTLVTTEDPVTYSITKTAEPETVTEAVPTTVVSIIDVDGKATTTVLVLPTPAPPSPPAEPTTTIINSSTTTPHAIPTIIPEPPKDTVTFPPTTMLTSTRTSSSRSYDDGQWHTIYPPWNGTEPHRFQR